MIATWFTGQGSQAMSEVQSTFIDNDVMYVVVRCARGTYDVAEPFAVLRSSDCILTDD